MKGLHVDEPALHVNISSSLNPLYESATSAASERAHHQAFFPAFHKHEELSLPDSVSKLHSSFPSQSMACNIKSSSFTEEKHARMVDCSGKSLNNLAEVNSWEMDFLSSITVPPKDEEGDGDDSVCRGASRMEGDNGLGLVGDLQAPMEARKEGNHNLGFKFYMGTDRDYARNVQASIEPAKGVHSGRLKVPMYCNEGKYADDLSAAMLALTCKAPPGDHSFGRFLPSNHEEYSTDYFSSDDFRMYEFKVRRCMRGRSHDWTECPFAHPGEKARRRDPRRFPYSGSACPDFRRGTCKRGDSCELSHGVFECWLHPARYRTQLCKDNKSCKRRVCFFAHSPSQLRHVSHEVVLNDGFALKSSLAAWGDAVDRSCDISHRNSSFSGQGPGANGYGGDLYYDDLSSVSIHGFLRDGVCDGFSPYTVLGERAADVGTMESFDSFSIEEMSNPVRRDHTHDSHVYMPSSNGCVLADEFGHDSRGGRRLYPYSACNPSDNSCLKTNQAHLSLRNQLAMANLTTNMEYIMSPTSTLKGHVVSPPLLSPPSSPSESPPISPGSVFSSRSMALSQQSISRSGQPQYQGLMAANGARPSITQFSPPLLASLVHSNGTPPLFANTRGPSPLSTNSVGDRQHDLEGFGSLPTSFYYRNELTEDGGSLLMGSMEAHPTHAMVHLMSTIKQMQESRRARNDVKSFVRTQNNPNTLISRESWEVNGVHRRIEGLRTKSFGQLGRREAGFEFESPDIGWVNELVK